MKRLLSLMLAAMMLFALVVVPTTAAEATDEAATTDAITPDTDWYDVDKPEFEISTAAQLLGFVELAQTEANFAHKTVRLTADIDLNPGTKLRLGKGGDGKYILPGKPANVWNGLPSWKGTFDGNGHLLSGVYVEVSCGSGEYGRSSLFGIISEGSVKNLIVENSFVCTKNVTTGTSNNAEGSSAAGIARRLQYGATVENLWLDMDVVTVGWSGGETAGVVARIHDNGGTIRNVAFAGTVAALHPDLDKVNTSGGMAVSQLVANQMWKLSLSIENAAMLGTSICKDGINGNLPICSNAKMSEINLHAVFGKHPTVEAAQAAGQYWDYLTTTTADFTYSLFAGGVIPRAVSEMMAKMTARALRVVGVQRSQNSYTAGEGADAYTAQSLRFVAGIRFMGVPLADFEKVGFLIQIDENGTKSHIKVDGTTVYTSITANDKTVTAKQEDSDYLVALSVQNVPIGEEFTLTITPYLIGKDGTKWTGEAVSATVLASGAYKNEVPTDASQNEN